MKSISELTDFYYKNLFEILQELETKRKKLRDRVVIIGIILTIVAILMLFSFKDIFSFILVGYIVIGGLIYKFLIKDYTSEFKHNIIKPLIKAIDENLSYYSQNHIREYIFNSSKLFSEPDKISGNDLVKGVIDGVNIEFSDIYAQKKRRNSKGRDTWSSIFKGLFISAEFHKHFKGRTIVLPDTAQSTFGNLIGNWLQSKNILRDELVKMDDIAFEKEFVVYSSDQIEARYILSNSLMQKLLAFKQKSKYPLYISFNGGSIYMAISYDKDLFEPTVFSSLLNYETAMEYVKTLHLAIGIVQELKLNEKLWSKK